MSAGASLESAAGEAIRDLTMSQLVGRTGVPAATIRYYLAEGLLPPPRKAAANRFLYDERHVELVRLIRLLRERRGLSLEAIGRVLPELLPDLLGRPRSGVFRHEMWSEVLAAADPTASAPGVRARIVALSTEAFSRRGYADVTVDDVCRAADMAKGTFYRYFSSKESLFLAVAAHVADRCAQRFGEEAGSARLEPACAVPLVARILGAHLPIVLDLTSLAAQARPGYAEALRAFTARIADAIAATLERPDVEPAAPDEIANDVLAQAIFAGVRQLVALPVAAPAGRDTRTQ